MIKLENTDVFGWEGAIRGMRNPFESWDKSDSDFSCGECIAGDDSCYYYGDVNHVEDDIYDHNWCNHTKLCIGNADLKLMKNLALTGTDHSKFLRMIHVQFDLTAPLYWYKQFDQYKIGVTTDSTSTMHKIHAKEFTLDDFSHEHLTPSGLTTLENVIYELNFWRSRYLETKDKDDWWQMIQLLPSTYNQLRTVDTNYQALWGMYHARKAHKLDEWKEFCKWIETLPYFKEIFGIDDNVV